LPPKEELGNMDRELEMSPTSLLTDTLNLVIIGTRSSCKLPLKLLCSALRVIREGSERLRLPLRLLWESSRCLNLGLVELFRGGRVPVRELFLTASTLIWVRPRRGATLPSSAASSKKTPATLPLEHLTPSHEPEHGLGPTQVSRAAALL
jgi:hypothetical protein